MNDVNWYEIKLVKIPTNVNRVGNTLAVATAVVNCFRLAFPLKIIPTNNFDKRIKNVCVTCYLVTDKKKEPVSAATPTGSGLNPKFNDENTKNSRWNLAHLL